MRAKRMIGFAAGIFFFGVFCWITGAQGKVWMPSEVVFIDPAVQDAATIEAHLPKGAEVVRLLPEMDGIAQISAHLAGKRNLSAIRIISHGNAGHFVLNGKRIDRDFLRDHGGRFVPWGRALSENGDIMLYACNLAATDEGKVFIEHLVDLTGADVAASTNCTGGYQVSGIGHQTSDHGLITDNCSLINDPNWRLEYACGSIEVPALCIPGYLYQLANQVVTNNNDSGAGSLRQAIIDVGSGEEITFDADYTITLASQLTIGKSMTITGRGEGQTIVQSNANPDTATYRVLEVSAGNTVTLSNMTIRNGKTADGASGSDGDDGGGILNAGTLTIEDCTISNNYTGDGGDGGMMGGSGGSGAGLYSTGSMTISESTLTSNTTGDGGNGDEMGGWGGSGAGLYSTDSMTISESTISNNTAGSGSGAPEGDGAGIYLYSGTVGITNSTISGNTNAYRGGGIYNDNSALTLTNCTLSGNACVGKGGGIYHEANSTTVSSCTIANNTSGYRAGGVYLDWQNLFIKNTIIANNSAVSDAADFYHYGGTLTNNGYNAVETQSGSDFVNGSNGCITGTTCGENLSTILADNGGSTLTLALSSGSVAINTIPQDTSGSGGGDTYNGCPPCDQRIYSRPDGDEETDNRDIGAYEYGAALVVDLASFTATEFEDHVLLEWVTASEIDTAGFHLWRSEKEDGEYIRITDSLIPAKGSPTLGAEYEYEDLDVEPGRTYYYKLEDIDTNGVSTFHTESVILRETASDPEASSASGSGAGCFIDSVTHNH
jgi:hypothetical protein